MNKLAGLKPESVFRYFEEIASVPRGSGDREKISNYCMAFAEDHGLRAVQDSAYNVIIYKDGTPGYENAEPVILQGHLDMVCQKEEDREIDFLNDGLELEIDGDFVKAKGTTLGADNGIAVAMALAILDSEDIPHPPLEVVFTTDEEVGMLGAVELDMSLLKGRKMLNMDSDDAEVLTVSCAGGSEFSLEVSALREERPGVAVSLSVKGLRGGHSGIEIDKGRVNANVCMARLLNHIQKTVDFNILSIDGGDKSNAIPLVSTAVLVTDSPEELEKAAMEYGEVLKAEYVGREPEFYLESKILEEKSYSCLTEELTRQMIFVLLCAPNGVVEMSEEIENLVETSLNLGVLQTENDKIVLRFALRSNKESALRGLEEKLQTFATCMEGTAKLFGQYPPWEYKNDSVMQNLYREVYREKTGREVKVEAIHAGLECGIFSSALSGLDCISMGPQMYDIHTTGERLSISSTREIFEVVKEVLKRCK